MSLPSAVRAPLRVAGRVLVPVGVAADVLTLKAPEDEGLRDDLDQVVAGISLGSTGVGLGLAGAAAAGVVVAPVAGVVVTGVLVGTVVYAVGTGLWDLAVWARGRDDDRPRARATSGTRGRGPAVRVVPRSSPGAAVQGPSGQVPPVQGPRVQGPRVQGPPAAQSPQVVRRSPVVAPAPARLRPRARARVPGPGRPAGPAGPVRPRAGAA